jgi:NAD-dependent SIR2 family protein deacetylase
MNEVFVLGAGASKAVADLPLGNELVWYYHICSALLKHTNVTPSMTTPEKEIREFLVLASKIYPELETILMKYDNGIKENALFPPIVNSKKYFADEILKVIQDNGDHKGLLLIKKLISKHLDQAIFNHYVKNNTYNNICSSPYNPFIKKFLLNNSTSNISIISFNFDYLLNNYHVNGVDEREYFDYLLNFKVDSEGSYKNKEKKKIIPLIKLHGSLDWGICNKCNKLRLYFPHKVANNYFGDSWPPVCSYKEDERCDGVIEPYIFLPHQGLDDRIKLLWDKADETLKNADKVTIIGYSFPEYDEDAINLFKNALTHNVKLEIVDPCTDKEQIDRIKGIFEHLKVGFRFEGFEKYLDSYGN